LMKSVLFLPIKMTDSVNKLAKIYINKVVRLHRIRYPLSHIETLSSPTDFS
jgi:hypothetical protein